MSVEALNCPNCGAAVESDRTQCTYCKARLKTVGCPKCLGLMFVGSRFCDHCGAIAAPVEVGLDEAAGDCPRCHVDLEQISIEETSLRACKKCDGLWIGVETFETVCADRERQSAVLGFINDRTHRGSPMTKVNYVPCPDCGELMNRNNFAKASGVIVDLCKRHGVWFDADELPAIIEFIQKGGMEIARQREKNELADERSKLNDLHLQQTIRDGKFGTGNIFGDHEVSGIRGFVQKLFS